MAEHVKGPPALASGILGSSLLASAHFSPGLLRGEADVIERGSHAR